MTASALPAAAAEEEAAGTESARTDVEKAREDAKEAASEAKAEQQAAKQAADEATQQAASAQEIMSAEVQAAADHTKAAQAAKDALAAARERVQKMKAKATEAEEAVEKAKEAAERALEAATKAQEAAENAPEATKEDQVAQAQVAVAHAETAKGAAEEAVKDAKRATDAVSAQQSHVDELSKALAPADEPSVNEAAVKRIETALKELEEEDEDTRKQAMRLMQSGVNLGVALAIQTPVWRTPSGTRQIGAAVTPMPYTVVAPGYWWKKEEARKYCASAWSLGSHDKAQDAAVAIARQAATRLVEWAVAHRASGGSVEFVKYYWADRLLDTFGESRGRRRREQTLRRLVEEFREGESPRKELRRLLLETKTLAQLCGTSSKSRLRTTSCANELAGRLLDEAEGVRQQSLVDGEDPIFVLWEAEILGSYGQSEERVRAEEEVNAYADRLYAMLATSKQEPTASEKAASLLAALQAVQATAPDDANVAEAVIQEVANHEANAARLKTADIVAALANFRWDAVKPARCGNTRWGVWAGFPIRYDVLADIPRSGGRVAREYTPKIAFGFAFIPNAYVSVLAGLTWGTFSAGDGEEEPPRYPSWTATIGLGGNIDLVAAMFN